MEQGEGSEENQHEGKGEIWVVGFFREFERKDGIDKKRGEDFKESID